MEEFRFAEIVVHSVGPDGVVARVESNPEHRVKIVAASGNEVRSVAVRSDLHDFSLREAAEVEDLAIGIPGEPFRNQVFLLGDEAEPRLGDGGKFAMNFFDELGEFVRSMQSGKFAFSCRVKTLA